MSNGYCGKHNNVYGAFAIHCPQCQDEKQLCADCGFEIKPPLGIPITGDDSKVRCAACAVEKSMRVPSAMLDRRA